MTLQTLAGAGRPLTPVLAARFRHLCRDMVVLLCLTAVAASLPAALRPPVGDRAQSAIQWLFVACLLLPSETFRRQWVEILLLAVLAIATGWLHPVEQFFSISSRHLTGGYFLAAFVLFSLLAWRGLPRWSVPSIGRKTWIAVAASIVALLLINVLLWRSHRAAQTVAMLLCIAYLAYLPTRMRQLAGDAAMSRLGSLRELYCAAVILLPTVLFFITSFGGS